MSIMDTIIAYKFAQYLNNSGGATNDSAPPWIKHIQDIKSALQQEAFTKIQLTALAAPIWRIKEESGLSDVTLLEKEFMLYLDNTDLLIVEDYSDSINTVTAGKYSCNGQILYTKIDLQPIGRVFNEDIFAIPDILTKKELIASWSQLKKL